MLDGLEALNQQAWQGLVVICMRFLLEGFLFEFESGMGVVSI